MRLRNRLAGLRDAIHLAAEASGARDIRLFGSVARGEEDDASDVDFLVKLDAGRTLLDLARLEMRLEELLGRPVDVVTENSLQDSMRSVALRESIRV
jgi:uncharacterized protein